MEEMKKKEEKKGETEKEWGGRGREGGERRGEDER